MIIWFLTTIVILVVFVLVVVRSINGWLAPKLDRFFIGNPFKEILSADLKNLGEAARKKYEAERDKFRSRELAIKERVDFLLVGLVILFCFVIALAPPIFFIDYPTLFSFTEYSISATFTEDGDVVYRNQWFSWAPIWRDDIAHVPQSRQSLTRGYPTVPLVGEIEGWTYKLEISEASIGLIDPKKFYQTEERRIRYINPQNNPLKKLAEETGKDLRKFWVTEREAIEREFLQYCLPSPEGNIEAHKRVRCYSVGMLIWEHFLPILSRDGVAMEVVVEAIFFK
jgi:hypothetical protein